MCVYNVYCTRTLEKYIPRIFSNDEQQMHFYTDFDPNPDLYPNSNLLFVFCWGVVEVLGLRFWSFGVVNPNRLGLKTLNHETLKILKIVFKSF